MVTVKQILCGKNSQVLTTSASTTVLEATDRMNEHKIGSLVVTDGDRIVGMFTERDVLRRVVGEQRRPEEIPVADVMTSEVICCTPDTPIDEASRIMKDRRIRHLPVCEPSGRLLGLISIGDLNAYHASDQEATIFTLSEYIHGRLWNMESVEKV